MSQLNNNKNKEKDLIKKLSVSYINYYMLDIISETYNKTKEIKEFNIDEKLFDKEVLEKSKRIARSYIKFMKQFIANVLYYNGETASLIEARQNTVKYSISNINNLLEISTKRYNLYYITVLKLLRKQLDKLIDKEYETNSELENYYVGDNIFNSTEKLVELNTINEMELFEDIGWFRDLYSYLDCDNKE